MQSLRIAMPPELFAPAACKHFEGEAEISVIKAGPDLYDFAQPLSWQADVTNTGGALLVTGEVRGTARTSCARCLAELSFPVMGEIEGYFLIEDDTSAPDDMEDDEFDVLPEDRSIDFEPLITAALLLEFPLVPLCKDDCKGLCPTCGSDLNDGPCGCAEPSRVPTDDQERDVPVKENPFAVLKNYRFDAEDADE